VALHDQITVQLQVALDSDPTADTPAWTTIASNSTALLRSWSIRRGRNSTLDTVQAGTASFVLDNRDRRFDPLHAAGAYYGKLKPGKRVRLLVTYAGTTYTRFDGYVDGWPQRYPSPSVKDALVELSATDGFKRLARMTLPSVWEQTIGATTPVLWYRLADTTDSIVTDSSSQRTHGTFEGGNPASAEGLIVGDPDPGVTFTGSEYVHALGAGASSNAYTIEAWVKLPPVDGAAHDDDGSDPIYSQTIAAGAGVTVSVAHRSLANLGTVQIFDGDSVSVASVVSSVRVDDDKPHHIAAVRDLSNTLHLYVDGEDVTTPNGAFSAVATSTVQTGTVLIGRDPSTPVGWGAIIGVLDEVLVYDEALDSAAVAAHYDGGGPAWDGYYAGDRVSVVLTAAGWPASARSIDSGASQLGPAILNTDPLSHLQDVALTEGGRLYVSREGDVTFVGRYALWTAGEYTTSQATFSDNGGLPYTGFGWDYSDQKVRNDIRVNPQTGSVQAAADPTSQDDYGTLGYSQVSLDRNVLVARGQANWLLAKYKDAAFEVDQLDIDPLRSPATLFPVVLAAELGYRYTISRTPLGVGAPISEDVHLEGTSESGDSKTYHCTWQLSRAEPEMFIVGTSTLDGPALVGY
jgi:hypothetical protein